MKALEKLRAWWRHVSPWSWTTVRDTGITRYQVHPDGRRRVDQRPGCYQPIDRGWLASGEWSQRSTPQGTMGVPPKPEVDGQGVYASGECPASGCAGVGPFYRVICEVCSARGCDECLVNDGDGLGYVCDDCRVERNDV